MALTEDFDAFLSTSEHAVIVTRKPAAGGSLPFSAIFGNEYLEHSGGAGSEPLIGCKTVDADILLSDDTLTIDGVDYFMREHQPDGTGWSLVLLGKK